MTGMPCIGLFSGAIPEVAGPDGMIFEERDALVLAWCNCPRVALAAAYLRQFEVVA
jgi:hypothetical protein